MFGCHCLLQMKRSRHAGAGLFLFLFVCAFTCHSHPLDTWHQRFSTNTASSAEDLIFAGNSFVNVGTSFTGPGFILTSSNGVSWTHQTTSPLLAVTYGQSN